MQDGWRNQLFFGDNLDILRRHVSDESVDLIYLDPPFNSNANYNVLFAEKSGEKSAAQITAFEDTWHWSIESEKAFHETVTDGPQKLSDLLQSLRSFLGQNDMMAYLTMIAPRLVELHRALKKTGSIYLHCDTTASHYLKLLLDAVFGPNHFENEIIWKRYSAHSNSLGYGAVHDVILYYVKSDSFTFNRQFQKYDEVYIAERFRFQDSDGRRWSEQNLANPALRPNLIYSFTASNGITYHPPSNLYGVSSQQLAAKLYCMSEQIHS